MSCNLVVLDYLSRKIISIKIKKLMGHDFAMTVYIKCVTPGVVGH